MVQFDFLAVPFGWDQTWQILLYPGTIFSRWVCLPSSSLLPMYPPGNEGTFQDPEVELKFQEGQLRVAPIAWNSIVPMISFALVLLRRGWRLIWGIFFLFRTKTVSSWFQIIVDACIWATCLVSQGYQVGILPFSLCLPLPCLSFCCNMEGRAVAYSWHLIVFKCHSFPMKLL